MFNDHFKQFTELISPRDVVGLDKIRVGNKNDGGYVVLKELCEKTDHVYSYGIGDDCSFELDFAEKFPNVQSLFLFDPFISKLPADHSKFEMVRTDFADGMKYYSVIDENTLLKVDVEWAEWKTLLDYDIDRLKKFGQVVIELHLVHADAPMGLTPYFTDFYDCILAEVNAPLFEMYHAVLSKLNGTHVCHHIHANNSLPLTHIGGYKIPPLIEMSFVNRRLVHQSEKSKESFPVEGLDFPNKTDRPDILNWWPIRKVCD